MVLNERESSLAGLAHYLGFPFDLSLFLALCLDVCQGPFLATWKDVHP